MFSIDHQETQFDLRFHVGSIPVRVSPWFWLGSVLLGWSWTRIGMGYLLLWIVCCFVSILLHELGHVWMGMAFGSRGHILLWSFGGLAIGSNDLPVRWQRIAVSLAGPGIQLVLYGILWLSHDWIIAYVAREQIRWFVPVYFFLQMLMAVNLIWPLLNLLPIFPLDGGQVCRELCTAASPQKGMESSLYISIGVAGILALHCFMDEQDRPLIPFLRGYGDMFMAIWFAVFCILNIQMLQAHRNPWRDDRPPWER